MLWFGQRRGQRGLLEKYVDGFKAKEGAGDRSWEPILRGDR